MVDGRYLNVKSTEKKCVKSTEKTILSLEFIKNNHLSFTLPWIIQLFTQKSDAHNKKKKLP